MAEGTNPGLFGSEWELGAEAKARVWERYGLADPGPANTT